MASQLAISLIRQAAEKRLEDAMVQIGEALGIERPQLSQPVRDPALNQARQMESIAAWAEQVAEAVTSNAKQGAKHG